MGRKFRINGRKVAFVDATEEQARAKYLRARQLPGTSIIVTDLGLYPVRGSAGLRAAADMALAIELEASIKESKK